MLKADNDKTTTDIYLLNNATPLKNKNIARLARARSLIQASYQSTKQNSIIKTKFQKYRACCIKYHFSGLKEFRLFLKI